MCFNISKQSFCDFEPLNFFGFIYRVPLVSYKSYDSLVNTSKDKLGLWLFTLKHVLCLAKRKLKLKSRTQALSRYGHSQCDQIFRNFAALAKLYKSLANCWQFIYFLFVKMLSLLWQIWYIIGLIFIVSNGQKLKIIYHLVTVAERSPYIVWSWLLNNRGGNWRDSNPHLYIGRSSQGYLNVMTLKLQQRRRLLLH